MGAKRTVGVMGVVALLAACSGDDPPQRRDQAPNSSDVEWLDVELEQGRWDQFEPVAVGDTLLAMDYGSGDNYLNESELMRSDDLGETWSAVDLPGRPRGFGITNWKSFHLLDGVAILTGVDGEYDGKPYVWASDNGVDWHGGKLGDEPVGTTEIDVFNVDGVLYVTLNPMMVTLDETTPFQMWRSDDGGTTWSTTQLELPDPENVAIADLLEPNAMWKHSDGQIVVPIHSELSSSSEPDPTGPSQRHAPALLSADGGLSWKIGECPIADLAEYAACAPAEQAGRLTFEQDQVSVDGGRTWQPLDLERSDVAADVAAPNIEAAVELPGGGWLAKGGNYMPSGDPFDFLARSDDGLSWDMLLPPEGRPAAGVSAPLQVGDHWLVAFSVIGRDKSLHSSQLYVLDGDGRNLRPIPGTETDGSFGRPMVAGETVLVPEEHQGKTRLLRIRL